MRLGHDHIAQFVKVSTTTDTDPISKQSEKYKNIEPIPTNFIFFYIKNALLLKKLKLHDLYIFIILPNFFGFCGGRDFQFY